MQNNHLDHILSEYTEHKFSNLYYECWKINGFELEIDSIHPEIIGDYILHRKILTFDLLEKLLKMYGRQHKLNLSKTPVDNILLLYTNKLIKCSFYMLFENINNSYDIIDLIFKFVGISFLDDVVKNICEHKIISVNDKKELLFYVSKKIINPNPMLIIISTLICLSADSEFIIILIKEIEITDELINIIASNLNNHKVVLEILDFVILTGYDVNKICKKCFEQKNIKLNLTEMGTLLNFFMKYGCDINFIINNL